ncbi:hypothetical protein [Xanthomonas phage RTH11]|nr:hypothetical protein [Xanthomonas phage RTH11]
MAIGPCDYEKLKGVFEKAGLTVAEHREEGLDMRCLQLHEDAQERSHQHDGNTGYAARFFFDDRGNLVKFAAGVDTWP